MEALRLLRHAGFGAIEANGGGGVRGRLGVGNFAGQHHPSLNGFREYRLPRFGVLIPAKRLARKKRIAEPLQSNESMSPTLGFGQRSA